MKNLISIVLLVFTLNMGFAQMTQTWYCPTCPKSIEVGGLVNHVSGIEGANLRLGYYIGYTTFLDWNSKFDGRVYASFSLNGANVDSFAWPLTIYTFDVQFLLDYSFAYDKIGWHIFAGPGLSLNGFFGYVQNNAISKPALLLSDYSLLGVLLPSLDANAGVGYRVNDWLEFNFKMNYAITNIKKDDGNWHKYYAGLGVAFFIQQ